MPHHVTQRGNRRQKTFFCDEDYRLYRRLMASFCAKSGVGVWAYCLMPNHVHLMLLPGSRQGLAAAVGEAHRRYTCAINGREDWRGYLWQGRFGSFPIDSDHLLKTAQYIELNPVRAGLVRSAEDWPWSSARAHLSGCGDGLADPAPLLELVPDWNELLAAGLDAEAERRLRLAERTGPPPGSAELFAKIGR
jgi:putative transposase